MVRVPVLLAGSLAVLAGCIGSPSGDTTATEAWANASPITPHWANRTLDGQDLQLDIQQTGSEFHASVRNVTPRDLQQGGTGCGLYLARQQDAEWVVIAIHTGGMADVLTDLDAGETCRVTFRADHFHASGGPIAVENGDRIVAIAFPGEPDPLMWGWTTMPPPS